MNKNKTLSVLLVAALVCITGCAGSPQKEWLTDFSAAQQRAAKNKKPILAVFSAPSFNEESVLLDRIVTAPEFIAAAAENFVLCYTEYSREDDVETDPVQQEKYRLADTYRIPGLPAVALITPSGFMYYCDTYSADVAAPEEYLAVLMSFTEKKEEVTALEKQAAKASGVEKAEILDRLVSCGLEDMQGAYRSYMQEIISLDRDDEAGLFTKYTATLAYMDAGQLFESDPARAIALLENLTTLKSLPPAELQKTYYLMSYFMAMNGAEPAAVAAHLNAAIDADPDNPNAAILQALLENVQSMPETE